MRIRLLGLLVGCLAFPATAGAAVVPTTGALLRAPADVIGVCQRQTPPYPDTSTWGPEKDGTPYHATLVYSSFAPATGDTRWPTPNDVYTAPQYDPTLDPTFPGTRPCDFGDANGKRVLSAHLTDPGAWVMTVTTETFDEHYDSVSGWVSEADDMSTTTKTVFFQIAAHNACHNGWFGTVPGTVACLNDSEKADAKKAEDDYRRAAATAAESYGGLGCGPGVTPNGEHPVHSTNIGRETQGACLAASAARIYNGVMAEDARQLAADPPVKDYKTLATPRVLRALTRLRGLPRSATALRAILQAEAAIPGLVQAIAVTDNRANGAFVAGDVTWTRRQTDAATNFASDIQRDLETIQGYAAQARGELRALGAGHRLSGLITSSQSALSTSLSGLAS